MHFMGKKENIALNRGERLKRLRQLSGLSRKAIERKYNVSASSITAWENPGKSNAGLSDAGARKMLHVYQEELIQCSLTWLLTGKGTPPHRQAIENADTKGETFVAMTQISMEDEIAYFKERYVEAMVFEVTDDSMIPYYRPGDFVGGIRCYAKDIPHLITKDAIVETQDGRTYFRRLGRSTIPGRYNLIALNPDTKLERPTLYEVAVVSCAWVTRHWHGPKW